MFNVATRLRSRLGSAVRGATAVEYALLIFAISGLTIGLPLIVIPKLSDAHSSAAAAVAAPTTPSPTADPVTPTVVPVPEDSARESTEPAVIDTPTPPAVTTQPVPDGPATGIPGVGVLATDDGWVTGLMGGDYTLTWHLWWGQNATSVAFYENGELVGTQQLTDNSPQPQVASVHLSNRLNGTYVYTVVETNRFGSTASQQTVLHVTDAAPAKGVIVSTNGWDNGIMDGAYTIKFDLWTGTNGTQYRLYENGVLIDSRNLESRTPGAQEVITPVTGRLPGRYTYVAELENYAGVTQTQQITVQVLVP